MGCDWYLDRIHGGIHVHKFGRNPDVDSAADEDVWDGGGLYSWPTAARLHDIASDDIADTAAGTGARTIRIYGLDANYDETMADVVLNGTTDVETSVAFLRIYRMKVLTAGSGGANAGNITATAQVDSTVSAQISIGNNQTLMALYTVPNGYRALMVSFYVSALKQTSGAAELTIWQRDYGGVFQLKHVQAIHTQGMTSYRHEYSMPRELEEKTDIICRAGATANNMDIASGFEMLLQKAS